MTEPLVDYLSPEWLARFERLVRAQGSAAPVSASTDAAPLTIGFLVEADDSGAGAQYCVTVEDGHLGVIAGTTEASTRDAADVLMISSRTIAAGIATGERSALDAFMAGDLRLDGETTRLLDARETLVELADLTGELRATTRF